jgi:hypothetical protein
MDTTVNEDHWDLLPVLVIEPRVIKNRPFLPPNAEFVTYLRDLLARLMAQMAVRFPNKGYPDHHSSP